jgi:hypothetical protein
MLGPKIATTRIPYLREEGASKHSLGLLPCVLAPVAVVIFLRDVHLSYKPPHELASECLRRVFVQRGNNFVQCSPRFLFVHLGTATELNTLLRSTWRRIVFPVPGFPVYRLTDTAWLISPRSFRGHERVSFPRLCHEFLNLYRLYHAASPPFSFRSRHRAIDCFRNTIFRPYWLNGSGSLPAIKPRRRRWNVATLQPSVRSVSCGVTQSRNSRGGRAGDCASPFSFLLPFQHSMDRTLIPCFLPLGAMHTKRPISAKERCQEPL